MSNPQLPLSCRRGKEADNTVEEVVPQRQPGRRRRPYLLKMLRDHLGTDILADTLDWDALTHFNFDATVLSLDNVYKGLCRDRETYYFLWVAVRKVLADAPPNTNKFSGARVSADQKTQVLNELLDATLEQFLAELGDSLMNLVEGPHCTIVDPRADGDPHALQTKARNLITRFEKLGRNRDTLIVAIPATEAGIEAAASLQREDGINVNLTSVSGVLHAAACAQAGAALLTLPIEKTREWRRSIGRRDIVAGNKENSGAGGEDLETIAAYFELHGFSSTGLIASKMDHVDDACPLGALAALSFDADQVKNAEWYTDYPNVRCAPLKHADIIRRAGALPPPPPPPTNDDEGNGDAGTTTKRVKKRHLQHLSSRAFSAFAAITGSAVGSDKAAMTMIANMARREIEWQLLVMQPSLRIIDNTNTIVIIDNKSKNVQRRHRPWRPESSRVGVRPATATATAAAVVVTRVPAAHGQHDDYDHRLGKRKRGAVAVAEAPDSDCPRFPPEKRAKHDSSSDHHLRRRSQNAIPAPDTWGGGSPAPASAPLQRRGRPLPSSPPLPLAKPFAGAAAAAGAGSGACASAHTSCGLLGCPEFRIPLF